MFGPHLMIDGSHCNTRKLADRIVVEQVLNDYPTAIGMTKIGGPYMFDYQAPDPAYSGVSGLVVIAESHIAIHTFPELDYFTLDIFSCKNFDHEQAIAYIRDAFEVGEMDRILLQRGLSFKGPHHGRLGATDELIAAAEARLAAGIVSKDPALPDAPAPSAAEPPVESGRMLWPQYGVTPDIGTYGDDANVRAGATIRALTPGALPQSLPDGRTLPACDPVQINPTASISGLLDKLSASGGQGRALGRALALWERAARSAQTSVALTLARPVIADGLRETLVYTIEHGFVDVIVASADDLFADLYEALGHAHLADDASATLLATDEGIAQTRAFIAHELAALATEQESAALTGVELWRQLGERLTTRTPRKGMLQAAARAGIAIFAPDLPVSAIGRELLAVQAHGARLTIDATGDLLALADILRMRPQLAWLAADAGLADDFLRQGLALANTENTGGQEITLAGAIKLGVAPTVS
ncbi:MAG TPA: adenosylmethionine decarboxylase, partial [Ktedonobacterales bacterium]|nr:adenosylmethionine decarboxylase [Ktedonobacterales bacterium]